MGVIVQGGGAVRHGPGHHERTPVTAVSKVGLILVQRIAVHLERIDGREVLGPAGERDEVVEDGDHAARVGVPGPQGFAGHPQRLGEVFEAPAFLDAEPESPRVLTLVVKLVAEQRRMSPHGFDPAALPCDLDLIPALVAAVPASHLNEDADFARLRRVQVVHHLRNVCRGLLLGVDIGRCIDEEHEIRALPRQFLKVLLVALVAEPGEGKEGLASERVKPRAARVLANA